MFNFASSKTKLSRQRGGKILFWTYSSLLFLQDDHTKFWTSKNMLSSFGKSVATGDFDGNGFSDFAIGAPLWSKISKDGFVIPNIGKVQIVYVSNFDTDVGNFEISRKFGSKLLLLLKKRGDLRNSSVLLGVAPL